MLKICLFAYFVCQEVTILNSQTCGGEVQYIYGTKKVGYEQASKECNKQNAVVAQLRDRSNTDRIKEKIFDSNKRKFKTIEDP